MEVLVTFTTDRSSNSSSCWTNCHRPEVLPHTEVLHCFRFNSPRREYRRFLVRAEISRCYSPSHHTKRAPLHVTFQRGTTNATEAVMFPFRSVSVAPFTRASCPSLSLSYDHNHLHRHHHHHHHHRHHHHRYHYPPSYLLLSSPTEMPGHLPGRRNVILRPRIRGQGTGTRVIAKKRSEPQLA